MDAIKNQKSYSFGAFEEYCATYSSGLGKFRIDSYTGELDDVIVKSIEEFLPFRNEFLQVVTAIAQYAPQVEYIQRIHRFFEDILPYTASVPEGISLWRSGQLDNFKFIVHELFLNTFSILLRYERFEQATVLVRKQYYLRTERQDLLTMTDYLSMEQHLDTLDFRNRRLKAGRVSIQADMIKERATKSALDFRYLMQADFVLFLRSDLLRQELKDRWWPCTLVYADRLHRAFEIFAKSSSKSYLAQVQSLLGIKGLSEITNLLEEYRAGSRQLPSSGFSRINPRFMMGVDELGKKE